MDNKKSKKELIRKAVFIAAAVVFIYFCGQMVFDLWDDHEEKAYETQIQNLEPDIENTSSIDAVTDTTSSVAETETKENAKKETEDKRKVQKWAKKLLKRNKEVVGWIKIPEFTNSDGDEYINFPVVQHSDNSYYLTHNIDKKYYESGSIFADYVVPIDENGQADNITLYGHHMRKLGTSFTHLAEYKSGVDLLKKCPIIEFNTIYDTDEEYVIFSCYVAAVDETQDKNLFDYWNYRNFDDDNYTFKKWLKNTKKCSWYSCDIECDEDDDYLTLSTCSNEVANMRWVIVAKKIDDSDDKDKILKSYKAKDDKDIYFPPVWTKVWGNHTKYLGWAY